MIGRKIVTAVMLIGWVFPSLGVLADSEKANPGKISVAITHPASQSRVGQKVVLRGQARLPGGLHLWIVARHIDFKPLWYPQREAEVNPATGWWASLAYLGDHRDIGSQFDIGAIVVNGEAHAQLHDYWVKAMQTGNWRPVEIPETVVAPELIKVTKTRH